MSEPLLSLGIYDKFEAARIARVSPAVVTRWATGGSPMVRPSHGWAFSFVDLISLVVMGELYRRDFSTPRIRQTYTYLSELFKTERPFASQQLHQLSTAGYSVIGDDGEAYDASRHGQGVFAQLVRPYLRRLEYGPDAVATLWRPTDHVWLNPEVQAGAPCIDGRRIPTATIAEMVAAGDEPEDIASDFDLDLAEVSAAIDFEADLPQAA